LNPYDFVNRELVIRNLVIPNRVVFPPFVTGYSDHDGFITDRQVRFYDDMAAGGAGMIIVGATAVSPEGTGWMGNTRIDRDDFIPGLKKVFDVIKNRSCIAGLQLYHCGVSTNTARTGGRALVAPSAIPYSDGSGTAVELTRDQVHELEQAFVSGAKRAFAAGADFVEFHCAHGYLINQFLSPLTNRRKDEYGGSAENRARFALNIIEKTRQAVGKDRIVGVRIGGNEFADGGYTLEDAVIFCRWMVDKGADFIHVSAGMTQKGIEEMYNGTFVKLAAAIKKIADVPVICVGAIKTLERAEEILSAGDADLVAMGRALVADPGLVNKSFKGETRDVIDCIDCWQCITTMGDDTGHGMECTQNPDLP
jgi:2,4-dienoyl-CoA reductase-like NADH-dependent reductase (Old Yellow Enzyme family)